MKVKEIMTKEVVSVKPAMSALEVLKLLFKMQISGLPVVDEQGVLAGVITEKNILSYLLPSYIEKVGRFVYEENPKSTKKKFLELERIPVAEIMSRKVVTTTEEVTLCEVARVMVTQEARRIPVLDSVTKQLKGIVTRGDILRALANEAEISPVQS